MKHSIKIQQIQPTQEKPSWFSRIMEEADFEGCFIVLAVFYYLVKGLRYILGYRNKNVLELDAQTLTIRNGENVAVFNLDDIQGLRIDYNTASFIKDSDYRKYSKMTFSYQGVTHEYYYKCSRMKIMKLFRGWYDARIRFKEFHNEKRMFLGKKPEYKEIQEIKSKYGVDW